MKREELIRFAKHLRGWGIEIPSDIMEVSVEEYLSLSPSPQPSTAEEKPPHAKSSMDFLSILTKWCEYYDVSFSGRETAVIESAVHEYAAKAVAEREVPEEEMGLRLYQASDYLCEADLTRYDCDKIVTWMRQEEKRQSIERNQ